MFDKNLKSVRSGYLQESYRLFHLRDQVNREYAFHYHDFYKVVFFLEGKASYHIEGRTYVLSPGDILLVDRYSIHKPEIDTSVPYERFVLWIRADLEERLLACFGESRTKDSVLVKTDPDRQRSLYRLLKELEQESRGSLYAGDLMSRSLFTQLMVQINRLVQNHRPVTGKRTYSSDAQIEDLLGYINTHLTDDLSTDALAERYFISKYHLMRKFKEETGYTLHQYVLSKRLISGRTMIAEGIPVTKAAMLCGFGDYTTFVRAYKKQFRAVPGEARYLSLPADTENEE